MTEFISTPVGWRPPTVLKAFTLLLLAACAAGQSLQFAQNLLVGNGDDAVLECVLIGSSHGPPSFTWSGPAISNGGSARTSIMDSASGTSSKLIINGVGSDDAGQYTCSHSGISSVSTTLTVQVDLGFLSVPEHQKIAEGTVAVVQCPAVFGDEGMAWTRENDDNQYTNINDERFTGGNGQLTIQNVRMEDSGDYRCTHIEIGQHKNIRVEVVPKSEFAPMIDDTTRRIEVQYGEPLNLPCPLDEPKDNVAYSWTINTEFERNHIIDARATLHREADEFLGGRYTCRAENEYGYDAADFIVKITARPLPEMCSLLRKTTDVGTTVVLKYCDLTSPVQLSDLEFQWSKWSESGELVEIPSGGGFSINHNGWLTIENVNLSDLGFYQVNISNNMGFAIHTVQLAAANIPTSQPHHTPLSQLGAVSINLKFEINGGSISCGDDIQDLIQKHLRKQFGFADAAVVGTTINCAADSNLGTFKFNLRGSNARQLATQIRQKGTTYITLRNGRTLTLEVCTKECSLQDSVAPKHISDAVGGAIAATFIAVVLTGFILLMVVVVRYRRNHLTKEADEEQALTPHSTSITLYSIPPTFPTNQDNKGQSQHNNLTSPGSQLNNGIVKKKPVYGRSFSLDLPITSRKQY